MRNLIAILVITILSSMPLFGQRVWYFQEIPNSYGAGNSSIAMRTDKSWPVVAYGRPESQGGGGISTLTPAGWADGPFSITGLTDAASSINGSTAFVDRYGNLYGTNQAGWYSDGYSAYIDDILPSVSFDNNGEVGVLYSENYLRLATHSDNGWSYEVVSDGRGDINSNNFALDYDSLNQANIIYEDGGTIHYGVKGSLTSGQWLFSDTQLPYTSSYWFDLTLTSNDTPIGIYNDGQELMFMRFDIKTGNWVSGVIDQLYAEGRCTIATDSKGGVGVAYIKGGDFNRGMVSFAYTDFTSGWQIEPIHYGISVNEVGLDFDSADNPVISFRDLSDNIVLAYDPIIIPEPASFILVCFGLTFINKSRG